MGARDVNCVSQEVDVHASIEFRISDNPAKLYGSKLLRDGDVLSRRCSRSTRFRAAQSRRQPIWNDIYDAVRALMVGRVCRPDTIASALHSVTESCVL